MIAAQTPESVQTAATDDPFAETKEPQQLAREEHQGTALNQTARVIVGDHRERARSYSFLN